MNRTHKDAAEDDPQVGGGTEENTHYGAEDGTRACNIQELNEIDAPRRHRDVVHAVLQAVGGRLAVGLHAKNFFHKNSVEEIAQQEGYEGN